MVEINNRLFPYSIGVDLNEESQNGQDKYIVTLSYPNINAIGKNATQEDKIYVVSSKGRSIFEAADEMSTRLPYEFHFKHLRALVLGRELAKDEKSVREVLDGITRDFVINKKVKLIVVEGSAEELLNYKVNAKRQEVIEGALVSMFINGDKSSNYADQSLGDFIAKMDYTGAGLMPKAKIGQEDIKLYGACVFKDYECIGDLDESENKSLDMIISEKVRMLITVPFEDTSISYDTYSIKAKKKLIKEEDDFKIQIDILTEGKLREYILEGSIGTPRQKLISDVEKALKRQMEEDINKTVKKLQKEYKADVLGIGEYIMKFHPKIWEEVKDDWSNAFSDLEIEVNVTPVVRRRGLTRIKGSK